MKKTLAILLTLVMLAALLCGCGRSSYDSSGSTASQKAYTEDYSYDDYYYDYYDAPVEAAMAPEYDGYWGEAPAAAEPSYTSAQTDVPPDMGNVKMIYTARVEMESTEFDEAVSSIAALTNECGGYYESSSLSDRGYSRSASFSVRVPADKYRTFLEKAGGLCHVTYQQESAEDVSETYYDTAGRLETQKTKLARLQELLAEAKHMEDIIVLENEISETEELIDRLSGTLRHYDALVAYSTVNITLSEVKVFTEVVPVTETFGSRFASAFKSGLQDFADFLGDIAIALAYGWLWIVIIAVIVVVVLLLTKKKRAENRAIREKIKAAGSAAVPTYSHPGALPETPEEAPEDKTE